MNLTSCLRDSSSVLIELVDNTLTTDLVQTRDVHEAGVVDQGAARDVHGHGGSCGAAGGGRQQVFQYSDISQ